MRRAYPVAGLDVYLAGAWRTLGEAVDLLAGTRFSFSGTATFVLDGAGLSYLEEGELTTATGTSPLARRLFFRFVDPSSAVVYDRSGGALFDLDLRRGRSRATHPCGEDCYTVAHVVLSQDEFVVRWRARGPRKLYRTTTRFVRSASPTDELAAAATSHPRPISPVGRIVAS